mgnify:CR=1 FL=1
MRLALALSLIATGAVAQDCPTAADLENGIRLTRNEPFFSILQTATPEGLTEARIMDRGAGPEAVSSVYAHPLTVVRRISAGGVLELAYADDTAELNSLPGPRQWHTEVTLLSDGQEINRGTYAVRLSGLGDATIGDCSYTVWRINEVMTLDGMAPLAFEKSYAPDLGLVLSSIRLDPEGTPVGGVFFDEITAE